jgi:hypothetical protein
MNSKEKNQIAGFKSALLSWPTINKNVDWINYTCYNQQRFANYNRDTMKEIAEQLSQPYYGMGKPDGCRHDSGRKGGGSICLF